MANNLVIVESPAKAKTIEKYLGKDYKVLASYGHVRDLIPKEGAVDTNHHFAMKYELIARNKKYVDAIAKAASNAQTLYLATDPDREGEAISWHLLEILKQRNLLNDKKISRIVFYEITKKAISEAITHPREVSLDLVNAQQARRALDYLVGFNLSPLLWRKIKRGLSAGRVQSPALRMIVEREKEIEAFVSQEYWTFDALTEQNNISFKARLIQFQGHKLKQFDLNSTSLAEQTRKTLLKQGENGMKVASITRKERKRQPAPPFTTSTLQQESARKLGFSARKTMQIAQQLYEGIDLGAGPVGLISYMRTDSVNLSNEALDEIRTTITNHYGSELLPVKPNYYKTKSKNAQEAHEAIRPTATSRAPNSFKQMLSNDQLRLYDLIWKRTIASQMKPAILDTIRVDLAMRNASDTILRSTGSSIREPGFITVYQEGIDDEKKSQEESQLPNLEDNEILPLKDILAEQHFTEPPPRYSEASLIKALEEYGIGRPSTYASIISTLLSREYVELVQKRFFPTDIGRIVNRFLTEYFPNYVDYDFTARLEDELDEISRGEKDWIPILDDFWQDFHQLVEQRMETVSRRDIMPERELGADPKSGKPISVRMGRYGPYVQMGSREDIEKPLFAGLKPGQKMDKITLEEALKLFELPRSLGETEDGEAVTVNIGRFGPYVKYGSKYVSLKKEDDPYSIELPRALELIAEKRQRDAERLIQKFETSDGTIIEIQKGRWGPFVTDGTRRARIPKNVMPESVSLDQCLDLLSSVPAKKTSKKSSSATPKSSRKTRSSSKKSN